MENQIPQEEANLTPSKISIAGTLALLWFSIGLLMLLSLIGAIIFSIWNKCSFSGFGPVNCIQTTNYWALLLTSAIVLLPFHIAIDTVFFIYGKKSDSSIKRTKRFFGTGIFLMIISVLLAPLIVFMSFFIFLFSAVLIIISIMRAITAKSNLNK